MTVSDYTWINDSVIGEAGCVTVVPAADRQAVLANAPIHVAEVGDALVIVENNGF